MRKLKKIQKKFNTEHYMLPGDIAKLKKNDVVLLYTTGSVTGKCLGIIDQNSHYKGQVSVVINNKRFWATYSLLIKKIHSSKHPELFL